MNTSTLIKLNSRLMIKIANILLADYQITHSQASVILNLKGNLKQKDLVQLLGIEQPSAVRLIDRMVTAGLLERKLHPSDRRAQQLSLSSKGQRLLVILKKIANQINAIASKGLTSDEKCILKHALTKMEENLLEKLQTLGEVS